MTRRPVHDLTSIEQRMTGLQSRTACCTVPGMTNFEATAPNGMTYRFRASKAPAAVRFLQVPAGEVTGDGSKVTDLYVITTHRTVQAAGKSFTVPQWRELLRPDSVVTEIREV